MEKRKRVIRAAIMAALFTSYTSVASAQPVQRSEPQVKWWEYSYMYAGKRKMVSSMEEYKRVSGSGYRFC